MKRLTRVSLVAACGFAFALLFTAASPDARAQGGVAQAPAQTQDGAAPAVNPNDPVSLLGQLNLSPEQTAQMRSIQSESVPQAQALNRRLNQARRALDEAIYSDAVDENLIEQRAREVADAQAALVHFRAQTELRVRRVLTPEQLQQFRIIRQQAIIQQRQMRREQRIERQLEGGNPQRPARNGLGANPNRNPNRPNRLNQRPAATGKQPKQ
jgi:Spy/CpxP family protein refolding chaperone